MKYSNTYRRFRGLLASQYCCHGKRIVPHSMGFVLTLAFEKELDTVKLSLGRRVTVGWLENVASGIRLSASPSHQSSSLGGWHNAGLLVDGVADVATYEAPPGSVWRLTLGSPTPVSFAGWKDRRSHTLPPRHSIPCWTVAGAGCQWPWFNLLT